MAPDIILTIFIFVYRPKAGTCAFLLVLQITIMFCLNVRCLPSRPTKRKAHITQDSQNVFSHTINTISVCVCNSLCTNIRIRFELMETIEAH